MKRLLEWEELALLVQSLLQSSGNDQQEKGDASMQDTDEQHTGIDLDAHKQPVNEGSQKHPSKRLMQKIIMEQGPWYDEELTVAWRDICSQKV